MQNAVTCQYLAAGADNNTHRLIVCPEIIQNSRCQKVDMKQIAYSGPKMFEATLKITRFGELTPRICTPLN